MKRPRVRYLLISCPSLALWAGLIVLFMAVPLFPQGTAVVSGRLLQAADDSPIAFASVVVEEAASGQQLSGTLTLENGRFQIQGLATGAYKIRIAFTGFYPADADVLVSALNNSYDLGDIRLPRLEGRQDQISVTTDADAVQTAGFDTQVFQLDQGPV